MESKLINVVWCDDKIDTLFDESSKELFSIKNCQLYKKAKTGDELLHILKDDNLNIDAVIVDFNLGRDSLVPESESASGFSKIHEHINEYKNIPFYLCTGRDTEFIKRKYREFEFDIEGDYFFEPNTNITSGRNRIFTSEQLEELLNIINEETSKLSTPEFKVRQMYSEGFSVLHKHKIDDLVFLKILTADYIDRYDANNVPNQLRKAIDGMLSKLEGEKIIPNAYKLNKIPSLLSGKEKDSEKYSSEDYIHKTLKRTFEFFLKFVQDGSHGKDDGDEIKVALTDYLKNPKHNEERGTDIYLIKVLVLLCLDFIKSLDIFYEKYKRMELFTYPPFEARAIDIKTVYGKEGAIVLDKQCKKYFVAQHPKEQCKYEIGTRIMVKTATGTKPEYGDYYATGENMDVHE